jgi:rhodanese-related sulfurtransferase
VLAHEHLDRDQQVLVYCHSGARAVMAERILNGLGFNDVTNIGGMLHYQHCS